MPSSDHLVWQRAHRALDEALDLIDQTFTVEEHFELPVDRKLTTRGFVLALAHEIIKEFENATSA